MNLKKIKKMAFALILLLSIILMMVPKASTGYSTSINETILNERGVGKYIDIDPLDYGVDYKKYTILHEDNWYCTQPSITLNSTETSYLINNIYDIENTVRAYIVNQKCTLRATGNSGIRKDTQVAYWNSLDYDNNTLKTILKAYRESKNPDALDESLEAGTTIYSNAKEWVNNIKNVEEVTISTNTQVENATITLNNFTSNDILGIYDKVYVDNIEKTSEVKDGKLTITRPSTRK